MYYNNDREPQLFTKLNKYGKNITYLNKVGLKRANDFIEIHCPSDSRKCPGTVYTSNDPRLLDVPRNIRLNLDVPPLDSNFDINGLKKDAIYNPKLCNYGTGYRNYEDVNSGQISYYIDSSISDPYYRPNFVIDSDVQHYVLKDPMGAFKPQYIRKPLTPFIKERNDNENILKNINDSTRFREDIMEGQMRKRNEMRYESRWYNNNWTKV